jgi:hypothetical protein
MGLGSIPIHIFCLGGLLIFLCLSALSYLADLPLRREERKVPMKETEQTRSITKCRIEKSLISTIWAIGTGMWSGLALSG